MLQIITDSAADLPKEIAKKHNIHVIPLTINIDGKEYIDGINLMPKEFYKKMATAKELPKTSQPPVDTFLKKYKKLS